MDIASLYLDVAVIDVTDKKELIQALVECSDSVVILDYTLFGHQWCG